MSTVHLCNLRFFILQACRGTKLDGGVRLVSRANTETDAGVNAYKIPSYADFLIAYSTVEDEKLSKMRESETEEEREREGFCQVLLPTTMPLHTPYKIPTIADFLIAYSTAEGNTIALQTSAFLYIFVQKRCIFLLGN
ncbi:uncharacterized protein LOC103516172 [Diaphorina citri]|uniref:Uncharacterized protein LOC103516172 n=1 Tax=Diaphorina citri TaxID=121845 RepID=A0A3Q0JCJ6_DIACI|nr:uncharacterized protein LOC103516172 [Diaphorina citri]